MDPVKDSVTDDEPDFTSLEYEEDCYYAFVNKTETPSFDVEEPNYDDELDPLFTLAEDEFEPASLPDIPENFSIETEFYDKKLGKNKFIRAVRVKFHDLSKPYFPKVTSHRNYTNFLQLVNGGLYSLKLDVPIFLVSFWLSSDYLIITSFISVNEPIWPLVAI